MGSDVSGQTPSFVIQTFHTRYRMLFLPFLTPDTRHLEPVGDPGVGNASLSRNIIVLDFTQKRRMADFEKLGSPGPVPAGFGKGT
jgi:hypothetical protein